MKPIPLRLVEYEYENHMPRRIVFEFDPQQLADLLAIPPIVSGELLGGRAQPLDEFRLDNSPVYFREAKP